MVATCVGWFGSTVSKKIQKDLYNTANKRNIRNTIKDEYNCAGYALGIFSWYMPFDEKEHYVPFRPDHRRSNYIDYWAFQCIHYMLHELKGRVRLIHDVSELKANEYAAAFRCGSYDFHVIKRARSGQWYEKMGGIPAIKRCSPDILNPDKTWFNGKYTSKIFLLAVRANHIRRITSNAKFLQKSVDNSPRLWYTLVTVREEPDRIRDAP